MPFASQPLGLDDGQFDNGVPPAKVTPYCGFMKKNTTYGYGGGDAQTGRGEPTGPLRKRDGRLAAFELAKIERAIAAAGAATVNSMQRSHRPLAEAVRLQLARRTAVEVEQVQDAVERALMAAGHFDTARAYIVYRERHARLRRDRKAVVDVAASMNEYLSREDWRVRANANRGYSLGGLILNVSGKVTANYWLDEVYSPEIGTAHREGDLHIHDRHARRLLRRLVAAHAVERGFQRHSRARRGGPAEAPVQRPGADGQLPRHAAERVGRRPCVQQLRYLPRALRARDRLGYDEVRQAIQSSSTTSTCRRAGARKRRSPT